MRIPLSQPDVTQADIDAVTSVLSTRHLSLGPVLQEFERRFAEYIGLRYAVAVSSGTAALHLCMLALNLQPGDEVITTPFSFISSANCILMVGAKPVFVDIDSETWNINAERIGLAISDHTRAILPVHVFGLPAQMATIQEIAAQHSLTIIEDSCEALGARYKDQMAGTLGTAATFAFYPNKQITTGEGGMLVTNRDDIANLARSLCNQGRDQADEWLAHQRLGYNYRLSDINCALGLSQLSRIDQILQRRAQVASWYRDRLQSETRLVFQHISEDVDMSWFVMVIRLADNYSRADRDRILKDLQAKGIGCSNYFTPIHLQKFYVERFGYREGDFPNCERIATRTLALPFHSNLSEPEVDEVCSELESLL